MHEVVKRCGTLGVTEVLVSQIMELTLSTEKLSELNLRLTVLFSHRARFARYRHALGVRSGCDGGSESAGVRGGSRGQAMRRFVKARPRHARQKAGEMNKTEAAYALWLKTEEQRGEILKALPFGSMTFKLADDTRYTPDFPVVLPDGTLELRDTKGAKSKKKNGVKIGTEPWVEEDAKIKIKVAAERFPEFKWALVWMGTSGWERREF